MSVEKLQGKMVTITTSDNDKIVISKTRDSHLTFWPHTKSFDLSLEDIDNIIKSLCSDEEIYKIRERQEQYNFMEEPHGDI